jgi:hypothetical protein
MLLWAHAFAVEKGVPIDHYLSTTTTLKALDLPLSSFLPSNETYKAVSERMIVIVQRILTEHMKACNHIPTIAHIEHLYSKECATKSKIVSICVFNFHNCAINILNSSYVFIYVHKNVILFH